MRDELRQLEGDRVIVIGTVSDIQQRPEGHYDVCIADVEIRRWDPEVPTYSVPPISVDHLWILKPGNIPPVGRQIVYLGDVSFYTRRNVSIDLGVNSIESMCLNYLFDQIVKKAPRCRNDRASYIAGYFVRMLDDVKAGKGYLLSHDQSEIDFLHDAADVARRLLRERELNEAALLSSTLARIQRTTTPTPQPCIPFL